MKTRDNGVNAESDATLIIEPRVSPSNHEFSEDLAGQPHRRRFTFTNAIPFLVANFEKRRRRIDSCAIDKNVGRRLEFQVGDERIEIFAARAVGGKNSALPPQTSRRWTRSFPRLRSRPTTPCVPPLCQRIADRSPENARTADDDRRATLQAEKSFKVGFGRHRCSSGVPVRGRRPRSLSAIAVRSSAILNHRAALCDRMDRNGCRVARAACRPVFGAERSLREGTGRRAASGTLRR